MYNKKMETINFGQEENNSAPKAPNDRKKKLIWAGVILAALILSVIGWQYWQYAYSNSGGNQPALIITSEPQPAEPQIKPIAVQPKIEPKSAPLTSAIAPTPAPAPVLVPKVATPTLTSMPAPSTAPIVNGAATSTEDNIGTGTPTPAPVPDSTPAPIPTPVPTPTPVPVVTYVETFSAGNLVINEIMYDLGGDLGDTDTNREWIEISNNSSSEIDLTGWKFNDGDDATNHGLNVPPKNNGQGSMILPVGGYLILAEHAETFLTDHSGFSGTVIDTAEMNLKNASSTITILKAIASDGTIIDEVTYYNSWGANGDGKTLGRKSAGGGSNDSSNWGVSATVGGTPGAANN